MQLTMALNTYLLRNGEYYYSNALENTDKVTFIGNSTEAKIKGVNILQFPLLQVPLGGVILYPSTEDIPDGYEEESGITAPDGYKYIKKVR